MNIYALKYFFRIIKLSFSAFFARSVNVERMVIDVEIHGAGCRVFNHLYSWVAKFAHTSANGAYQMVVLLGFE
jgi:hypothetical protein